MPPAPAPNAWRYSRTGHVYIARLLSEHPLYPQYQRLAQEIASLQKPCVLPTTPPVFLELGELFLPGPQPPRFPLEQFELRRAEWRLTLVPVQPASLAALDADLLAELRWSKTQAEERASAQVMLLESREDARVAEVRAEAVRRHQEALNNVGLNLTATDREARDARDAAEQQERRRLWTEIEQEVAAARAAADQTMAASRQQIDDDLQAQLRDLEAEAWQRVEKRREIFVKSGSEIRTRMSNAMTPPEPMSLSQGLSWQPGGAGGAIAPEVTGLLQREQRLRQAQKALLVAKRADLAVQIERGVELAVRRLAGLEGIRLTVPPLQAAEGSDMTESLRPAVRKMFQP
jgi:hypothetical protein